MIKVTCVCLDRNHVTEWLSSPLLNQQSRHPVGEINIVLATYILTCGLHIKQVSEDVYGLSSLLILCLVIMQMLEYFSHLRVLCFARNFYFKLQNTVLHKAVWMAWLYNQVIYKQILLSQKLLNLQFKYKLLNMICFRRR